MMSRRTASGMREMGTGKMKKYVAGKSALSLGDMRNKPGKKEKILSIIMAFLNAQGNVSIQ